LRLGSSIVIVEEFVFRDLVVRVLSYSPRGSGFDSQDCQIFSVAVGLERGPLSLVSINEEVLERKSSSSSLEN
jgi:hypothetical protein